MFQSTLLRKERLLYREQEKNGELFQSTLLRKERRRAPDQTPLNIPRFNPRSYERSDDIWR